MKLQLLDPHDQLDVRQLFSHVQQLQAAKPELALLKPLWLTISAAAAASTDSTQATLKGLVKAWRAQADDDSAEFSAELISLCSLQHHKKGHLAQVGPSVSTGRADPHSQLLPMRSVETVCPCGCFNAALRTRPSPSVDDELGCPTDPRQQ